MNENEFEFRGVRYVAAKSPPGAGCECCALYAIECVRLVAEGKIPSCMWRERGDMRNVIFLPKAKKV